MPKITFHDQKVKQGITFSDLQLNDTFSIRSRRSKGAVYRKVRFKQHNTSPSSINQYTETFYMLEEATGKLFDPTTSEVQKVNVDIVIHAPKPSIYG